MSEPIEENFMEPNAVRKDLRRQKALHLAKEVQHATESLESATIHLERAKRAYERAREIHDERVKKLVDFAFEALSEPAASPGA